MNKNTSTPAILMHGKKSHYEHRPMYWYDPATGTLILPDGTVKKIATRPLSALLSGLQQHMGRFDEKCNSVNLFIRAGTLLKNKPSKQYFDTGDGWKRTKFEHVSTIQANYERGEFTVHLFATSKYFGEEKDIIAIREAWYRLQSQLDDKFHYPNYMLRTTPASTGRDLLRVSLPKDVQYERLPDETLDVIYRHCCYGGRVEESFSPSRAVLENGVYLLDGTWMYASCLSHLPTGPCIHEAGNRQPETYESARYGRAMPSYPGFYHVTATVPQNWHHIGLLKEWHEHYRSDAEAHYPNTPGETFESWTTADELVQALAHGWHIPIHERLFFPQRQPDPFLNWYRKLADLREKASVGNTKNSLLKGAYRNIVLHTIGSFKQTYTWKDHIDLTDEQYRALEKRAIGLEREPRRKPGYISCRETVPLPRDRQPFVRPEWSAAVWGRARARLAEFALQLPYEDIVRLATDCVWSASTPDWVQKKGDWNKPGEFVVKDHISGPWVWPVDSAAMRRCVVEYNEAHNINEASFDDDNGGE